MTTVRFIGGPTDRLDAPVTMKTDVIPKAGEWVQLPGVGPEGS